MAGGENGFANAFNTEFCILYAKSNTGSGGYCQEIF
jgi:hypothetical protein